MGRIAEIKNIQKHRREVQRIAKEKGYSFPFHDFIKMINVFIFGDKIAYMDFATRYMRTRFCVECGKYTTGE